MRAHHQATNVSDGAPPTQVHGKLSAVLVNVADAANAEARAPPFAQPTNSHGKQNASGRTDATRAPNAVVSHIRLGYGTCN